MGTSAADWSALVVGEDLARVEPHVAVLRRANFSVRRILAGPTAVKAVEESAFDVVIVVLPFTAARGLLRVVRGETSASKRAGVVVVADEKSGVAGAQELTEFANRVLPAATSADDLKSAIAQLLNAAPRISVQGSARVRLVSGELRSYRLENISTTGMLLSGTEAIPVGAGIGFELMIPSLDAPIRGTGQIVRHVRSARPNEQGMAVSFASLAGDGGKALEKLIFQERAATGAGAWRGASGAISSGAVVAIRDARELSVRKEELAELEPLLEGLLKEGLEPRVKAAEWYVAAAELGLESLAAFSAILEAVHGGQAKRSDVSQQLADLADVRENLAIFAEPRQTVPVRIRTLLGMRRALERLLRALALTGAFGDGDTSSPAASNKPKGLVAELTLDIHRLLRSRRMLKQLPGAIAELRGVRWLLAPGARRRRAEEVVKSFPSWAQEIGFDARSLRTRRGRKEALAATQREIRKLDQRLQAVHDKVYTDRFREKKTKDLEADFAETKLTPILVETLAAGSAFLVRAYSAYKHALELTNTDPRLLDRVAGLAASIAAAERRFEAAPRR